MKTKYSDKELNEFKAIIQEKLDISRAEMNNLVDQLKGVGDNGTDDTGKAFIPDNGSEFVDKEAVNLLAIRQKKFVQALENALIRINNGSYGICVNTGAIIPRERLLAVPHATQCIEAKNTRR